MDNIRRNLSLNRQIRFGERSRNYCRFLNRLPSRFWTRARYNASVVLVRKLRQILVIANYPYSEADQYRMEQLFRDAWVLARAMGV